MTTGYPAAQPSAGTRLLACVGMLFYLIGSHLLLPAPVQGITRLYQYRKPCCPYRWTEAAPLQSGVHFEPSSEK